MTPPAPSFLRGIRFWALALVLALLPVCGFALDAKLSEITGLSNPTLVAVNPLTNRVYVAGSPSGGLAVIDGTTSAVLATLPIRQPNALAVNPVTNKIYLTNATAGSLTIVDGATNAVQILQVGGSPTTLAINSVTNTIYVGDFSVYAGPPTGSKLLAIDGATLAITSTIVPQPRLLAVNPARNRVLVGSVTDPADLVTPPQILGVVDGSDLSRNTFTNVALFTSLAENIATNRAYLDGTLGLLQVVDVETATVIGMINPGATGGGGGVTVNSVTNKIYIGNANDGTVSVIDGATGSALRIGVGASPVGKPVVNPLDDKVYVQVGNRVAVLDGGTNAVVGMVSADPGANPAGLAINPLTDRIYVPNSGANKLIVIDGNTDAVTRLPDAAVPTGVAADPISNQIFATDGLGLQVLDGNGKTITALPLGQPLDSLAANPADGKIYGLRRSDNTVTIIDIVGKSAAPPVTFGFQVRSIVAAGSSGGAYVIGDAGGQGAFQAIDRDGVLGPEIDRGTVIRSIAVEPPTNVAYVLTDTILGAYDRGTRVFTQLAVNPSTAPPFGLPAQIMAIDAGLRRVYFSDFGGSKLQIYDLAARSFLPPVNLVSQPVGVAVDQLTHQIYVTGGNSVTVVDGRTLNPTPVPIGNAAISVMTDDARNRAYVVSANGTLAVFAGGLLVETLPGFAGSQDLAGLAVNPVNGKVFSFDNVGKTVLVLTPVVAAQSGLATYISPLPGNTSFSGSFAIDLNAASLYGPEEVPVRHSYYQIDSLLGSWTSAEGHGLMPYLPLGLHTLYAFVTAGEEAAGAQSCPVVGQVAAYTFNRRSGSFQLPNPAVSVVDDQRSVAITVSRNFTDPATVDFQTMPGTAKPGSNYVTTTGTLTFLQGETTKTITVPILNQDFGPPVLTFSVALTNPSGDIQIAQPNQALVTVLDDHARDLVLSLPSFVAPQGATSADGSITATLDRPAARWRLFGELAWRASDTSAGGLVAGNYVVQFQPQAGYVTPPQQSVELDAFQHAPVSATYLVDPNPQTGGLTVSLTPAIGGWRIKDGGVLAYQAGDDRVGNLPAGTYLVEFQPVPGYATPPPQAVTITSGEMVADATYVLDDSVVGAAPVLVPDAQARTAAPYEFIGQIQTDQSIGTGFVPMDRVVATAAHLLFNENGSLSYSTGVRWLFQRSAGSFESPPQIPRGVYLFDGYATQRMADASPGVSTAASRQFDAAAMYFLEPAGRGGSSGYLGSDFAANAWLTGARLKLLAGYPSQGVDPPSLGHLFATSPSMTNALSFVSGAVFQTTALTGYAGMNGGPLCAQFEDGQFYPAAIYLGGTPGVTTVRAIDSQVVELFRRAEISGTGGANNLGGGITHVGSGLTGSTSLALSSVQVTLGPAGAVAAGARWLFKNQTTLRRSGQLAQGLIPGDHTVQFTSVPGYATPDDQTVSLAAGEERPVTARYVPTVRPTITSAGHAQAIRGQPFRYQTVATFDPTSFSIPTFSLPTGLTINHTTGVISGIPTTSAATPLMVLLLAENAAGIGAIEIALTVAEPGLLTVTKVGLGSVPVKFAKPSVQAVGSELSIKATAAAGYLFESWRDAETGAVLSTLPTYVFTMPGRINLQANFMVSPFVAGKGTYTGLLQGGTYDLSGVAKVTIGATGSFTANFNLGGSVGKVSNSFDVHSHYDGGFTLANNRLFSLSLDLAPGGILTGTVTDLVNAGQVPLGALRAAAKAPKGLAGAYTAAFPLATPDSALPGGTGFGRFTVSATGAVAFTGALGDGTAIMVAGQLNAAGAWPFFLPPAKIPQTVLGTLMPNAAAPFRFDGSLQWFRAPKDGDPLYPTGFTAQPLVFTSGRFTAPALVPTLKTQAMTSADLTFTGADLALPFDLPLNISRAGKGDAGSFSLVQATGLFSGSFLDPTPNPAVLRPFRGVFLQSSASGQGLFTLPTGATGAVLLQKLP